MPWADSRRFVGPRHWQPLALPKTNDFAKPRYFQLRRWMFVRISFVLLKTNSAMNRNGVVRRVGSESLKIPIYHKHLRTFPMTFNVLLVKVRVTPVTT